MKKIQRVSLVLFLVVTLISVSACQSNSNSGTTGTASTSGTSEASSTVAANDTSPVTLTFCPASSSYPDGVTHNPVLDQIAKDTGVTISYVNADQAKFQVLSASQSLPDIYQDNTNHIKDLISSGQATDLTSLIDKYGSNIKSKLAAGLNNMKEMYGGGTKVYGIPDKALIPDPSKTLIPQKNSFVGLFARYDIYQAVGSPKIASSDDYLNVLKQMQDYEQNELGKKSKVYAMSGWIDFGAQWPFALGYSQAFLNVDVWTGFEYELNCKTGDVLDAMDPNSALWQTYAWYNKAYRMGILDPEAFTQNNAQFLTKMNASTVLSAPAGFWQPDTKTAGDNAGLYVLPGTPYVTQITPMANPGNANMSWAISNNCKNPERAMQLLDYLFSDKGERLQINGIEGVDWATVNGVPQLIGQNLAATLAGTTDYAKQEGIYGLGLPTLSPNALCSDGYPVDLKQSAEQIGITASKADLNFASTLDTNKKGFKYPGQVYEQWAQDGLTQRTDGYPPDVYFYANMDTSLTATDTACKQYMDSQYAKIIMAKDDATFASVKTETIAKMKSLGSEKVFEAEKASHQTAMALKQKIGF